MEGGGALAAGASAWIEAALARLPPSLVPWLVVPLAVALALGLHAVL